MNNVSLMQLALARNLENSISGLGKRPLEEAKFGLEKAQLQRQGYVVEIVKGRQEATFL